MNALHTKLKVLNEDLEIILLEAFRQLELIGICKYLASWMKKLRHNLEDIKN